MPYQLNLLHKGLRQTEKAFSAHHSPTNKIEQNQSKRNETKQKTHNIIAQPWRCAEQNNTWQLPFIYYLIWCDKSLRMRAAVLCERMCVCVHAMTYRMIRIRRLDDDKYILLYYILSNISVMSINHTSSSARHKQTNAIWHSFNFIIENRKNFPFASFDIEECGT